MLGMWIVLVEDVVESVFLRRPAEPVRVVHPPEWGSEVEVGHVRGQRGQGRDVEWANASGKDLGKNWCKF
jgi:hypothetical protein